MTELTTLLAVPALVFEDAQGLPNAFFKNSYEVAKW